MDKLIFKLAGVLLEQFGSELANNGCNDPSPEMVEIIEQFPEGELEAILDEWNGGECEDCKDYDWILAKAIGKKLTKKSEE